MKTPTFPDKDQIHAWINNSSFLDDIPLDTDQLNLVSETIKSSDLLEELSGKIDFHIQAAYEEGLQDGEDNYKEDNPETIENLSESVKEEIGLKFAVEKFKDCKTLEDFQREFSYIFSDSLTYMR